jgi:hypothetical protein
MAEKPGPPDPPEVAPSQDTDGDETWVADQTLELHKLISDRHAFEREEGDHP